MTQQSTKSHKIMSHKARPYQLKIEQDCYDAWSAGARVVMPVLPTGGGKTVVIGNIAEGYDYPAVAIAHRQELVGQISVALAREGIRHDLLVPPNVRRTIIKAHLDKVGRDFTSPKANWRVGGVDTIVKMKPHELTWANNVGLVVQDEGHHVLAENKWGRAFQLFKNARGLFPTATPIRADGKGLGSHADGLVDVLAEGPGMRDLIDMGYLTDYQIFCPRTSDLNLNDVEVSATTGDYNQDQVRKAVRRSSKIVGDVVKHYLTHARDKLGVTFAVDVEEATKIAAAFRDAGIPAEVVSAKTPDDLRRSVIKRFENREILQLVNVDLLGEGFDLPAIEVVSMARPTMSFSLFCQQFGRALRLMITADQQRFWDTHDDFGRRMLIAQSSKPAAIIIDHVGNVLQHGLPDKRRAWSLDRRQRRASNTANDAIPLRRCLECTQPYERVLLSCPHCVEPAPEPGQRNGPEFVDGDLIQLDPETLAKMRGEVERVDGPAYPPRDADPVVKRAIMNRHMERQRAQVKLRDAIALWAGAHNGYDDRVNYKRFYLTFGVDVLGAQSLNAADAQSLHDKIVGKLRADGYHVTIDSEVNINADN